MNKTLVLGIETSCDETALALLEARGGAAEPRFSVLKNLVASQVKVHAPYGGVVPGLAKREHLKNLPVLFKKLYPKPYTPNPDLIAVTVGPGLEPALWTGIEFAKRIQEELSAISHRPLAIIGANHLEGHLYSFLLPQQRNPRSAIRDPKNIFPAISLIVSGGHTILLRMDSFTKWKRLGETRDDAVGEAFDKVARMLALPYPGGPALEKLARTGDPRAIDFPRPMLHHKNYDFSFSGLKTAVLYHLRDSEKFGKLRITDYGLRTANKSPIRNPQLQKSADVAASFQQAAIDVLVAKAVRAARDSRAKSLMLSGGVAANGALRKAMRGAAKRTGLRFFVADMQYNTDNAAMIAAAGYMAYVRRKRYKLSARGDMNI